MRRHAAGLTLVGLIVAACDRGAEPTPPRPAAKAAPGLFFAEVTTEAGLDFVHANGGSGRKYLPEIMGAGGSALDYDGDGWIDLYLVQSGSLPGTPGEPSPNRLYRNSGDGRFVEVTAAAGVGDTGYGMGSVAADYDADGDPDLYVVNFGPNVLYRNEGDGTFTDVTASAGVGDPAWGSSAAFFDADRDGHLDLYVVNYLEFGIDTHVDCGTPSQGILSYCTPDVYPAAADRFFRNSGDGTFVDATEASGLVETTGKGLGVVAADLTGDGWPDLYVANDSTPNFLFVNDGHGGFSEQGVAYGVSHNEDGMTEAGMGTDSGDVDRDGWPDLIVTNLSGETNALYLGGPGYFRYATRHAGLYAPSWLPVGFGTDFADFDSDGDLDLVVANGHVIDNIELIDDAQSFAQPAQLFLNDGLGGLTLLPSEGAGDISRPRVGRGSITLDYDNDGRLDLIITENSGPARLYRNLAAGGNWIGFDLRAERGNRDAIGAQVTISAAGQRLTEEKKAGSSYQTSGDPRLHFGLGAAARAEVRVRWPDGSEVEYGELPAGRYHALTDAR